MLRRLPTEIEALGRTCLFHDLSKRELVAVQQLGTVVDREAGAVVCRSGRSRGQVGIVISGEVAAKTPTGRCRHLGDGACFGSLSTAPGEVEREQVEAVTPVTVFVVGRREFPALRDACPRLAARLAEWRANTVPITT
jgi:CRP-like cAMP-binding protein